MRGSDVVHDVDVDVVQDDHAGALRGIVYAGAACPRGDIVDDVSVDDPCFCRGHLEKYASINQGYEVFVDATIRSVLQPSCVFALVS